MKIEKKININQNHAESCGPQLLSIFLFLNKIKSILRSCCSESQPLSINSETPDTDIRGWKEENHETLNNNLSGWVGSYSGWTLFNNNETPDKNIRGWKESNGETLNRCGLQDSGWTKIKTISEVAVRRTRESQPYIKKWLRYPIKALGYGSGYSQAFTLIELLIVVLIIGILAAIAVPQYQKAVWKSRAVQLQIMVKSLAQAQQAYFMANGTYATDFSSLDISFDSLPLKPENSSILSVNSTDAVRADDSMELVVNTDGNWMFSTGIFKNGPYQREGFFFTHIPSKKGMGSEKLYCGEANETNKGIFCEKVMGLKEYVGGNSYRFYPM